jgi:molybdopterin converting factor small subunit
MTVTIRLFASYAESIGKSHIDLDVPEGATIDDVVRHVSTLPGAERLPPLPLVAVNCAYAAKGTRVFDGDEVALIPPVAGG